MVHVAKVMQSRIIDPYSSRQFPPFESDPEVDIVLEEKVKSKSGLIV